jgi:hypothetical protein
VDWEVDEHFTGRAVAGFVALSQLCYRQDIECLGQKACHFWIGIELLVNRGRLADGRFCVGISILLAEIPGIANEAIGDTSKTASAFGRAVAIVRLLRCL